jgi:hypothetical protein
VEIKSTATQGTKTQHKDIHKNTKWVSNTTNVHNNTKWVLKYISTIMGMQNKSSPVAWVVVGNTIVTRGWVLRTWEATSVGSAWNPHRASSAFWGILFTWLSTNKAQPRLGLYETALESIHYDTIHPLTTKEWLARSLALCARFLRFRPG